MDSTEIPTFGEVVAVFRTRAGFSQLKLAEELGMNRRSIAAWEGGENLPKAKGIVLNVARILKLNEEETTTLLKAAGMDPILPVWNIPYRRNPHFTGRDEILDRLNQQLSPEAHDDRVALARVALTQPPAIKGLGGIGKTQIVVEYAYRAREQGHYTHILWVNAASEEAIMTSFVTLAELLPSFSAKKETDQRKLVAGIKRWLEQCKQRWLLIFDNADDLATIEEYLPKQGPGSIVLTTRADAVGSLATSIEVETMSFVEGTQLLLRRAQREDHASDEEINEAGNIVVALDHFPLALDQAGAYLEETKCRFGDYLVAYQDHRKALLARRGMQVTNYPNSVATTWSLSFQKVKQSNPAAAELLRLCAFLDPDRIPEELITDAAVHWTPRLAQAATDVFLFNQMIEDLLKFSLVKRLMEERMLSIHRLVQAVQIDTLEPDEQRQWAKRVVLAVNAVFPCESGDAATWPQCLRSLEQAQTCDALIQRHELVLTEAASLLNRTGRYLYERGLYPLAEPLFHSALRIWEESQGSEHPEVASSLSNLALLYFRQGKYAEAEPRYQRALSIREQHLGPEHLQVAKLFDNLAILYAEQGKYAEAEPFFQRALCIREQHLGPEHPEVAHSLNNLAEFYRLQGKYAEAEPRYQRALRIWEQHLSPGHPQVASPLNNLAILYAEQGKYAEAEPFFQRALCIWEQRLGPEHPEVASALNNLAKLYRLQGKYTEAEPFFQRALRIREQHLGPEHPQVASPLNNLAGLYRLQSKYTDAEPLYQRALCIWEQHLGPEHLQVAYPLNGLAELYLDQGKYAEAEPLYQRALSIREHTLEPHHPDIAETLHGFATLKGSQGSLEEATDLYKRALVIREKVYGRQHLQTTETRNRLCAVLTILGRVEETMRLDEAQPEPVETKEKGATNLRERQGRQKPQTRADESQK